MEAHTVITIILGTVATFLGLFGWSHKTLRQRLNALELELNKKPDFSDARTIMADKIAPIQVEYQAITRRMDDLQRENHKLSDKIDKLLVICTKISHDGK